MSTLGRQLTDLLVAERLRQKVSQEEMAARMGCSRSFIQRIEYNSGDRQCSGFDRYAEALGVTITVGLAKD